MAALSLWFLGAIALVVSSGIEAQGAQADLQALRERLTAEELLADEGQRGLRAAAQRFEAAERRAGNLLLAPVRAAPVAGRQLRSLEALAGAGAEVAHIAADAATAVDALRTAPDDRGRVETVVAVGEIVDAADARLAAVPLGPADALVGPLHGARADLADEVAEARTTAADARIVVDGMRRLLEGGRYLILASNNAEMQAGWGMPLAIGVLEVSDGELELGGMEPAQRLLVPEGAVPPQGDLDERWGFIRPTQDFRLLAVTPHFDQAAALAAEMWEALRGQPVDGVLALDPLALQAILQVTGPVQVEGRTVTAEEVVALSLHDSYVEQAAVGPGQEERQERQSAIAVAAVDALSRSDVDLVRLARSLADAASRRHVLGWSSRPAVQQAFEVAGIDGTLRPSSLLVSTLNRGANKLDWFMDLEAELSSSPAGEETEVSVAITVRNSTPEDEPKYIAGPEGSFGADAPGDWVGYLSVHIPAVATDVSVDGDPPLVAAGPSGPANVVAVRLEVDRSRSETVTVRFTMPAGAPLTVEPSGRVRPILWEHRRDEWDDGARRVVELPN